MRAELMERIQILKGADMITAAVADFCEQTVDYILDLKPDADAERFGMLITHLAMGTQRLVSGQEEHPVDPEILSAVRQEAQFIEAETMAEAIIGMSGITFTATEADFLKIHLCNLLS